MNQYFDDPIYLMQTNGSPFVKALAHLYCVADYVNKLKIRKEFANYFDFYDLKSDDGLYNKFAVTFCSQCGKEFGPGNHGFSSCLDHKGV